MKQKIQNKLRNTAVAKAITSKGEDNKVLAFAAMKKLTKKKEFVLFCLVFFMLSVVFSSAATNISVLHGWNGTEFVPMQVDSEGRLKTTLNLSESTGLLPDADNLRNIGSAALRWSNGYFVNLIATGNVGIGNTIPNNTLDVSGDANISGKLYAESANITATIQAATFIGDGSKLTGISTGQIWNSSGATAYLNDSLAEVGIGTTTPSERLVVIGNISVPGTLFVDNESNRVGIGNTLPNNTLDVSGDANISGKLYAESANITATIQAATFIGDGSKLTGISTGQIWNSSGATAYLNDSTAKVGIGISSPEVELEVEGGVNISGGLNVTAGNVLLATSSGNVVIGNVTPTTKLHVEGSLNVTGSIFFGKNLTGYGADLAEKITVKGRVSAGDVLVIDEYDDETLRLSERPYSINVAGVVSTDPSFIMSEGTDGEVIALAGRVPVKVTNENGVINRGDLLTTSSTLGHAMKFSLLEFTGEETTQELADKLNRNEQRRNSILGKALEPCYEKECKIIVLVTLQ